ncbi:hypothetical protein [Kibdelosporangium aridum]
MRFTAAQWQRFLESQ